MALILTVSVSVGRCTHRQRHLLQPNRGRLPGIRHVLRPPHCVASSFDPYVQKPWCVGATRAFWRWYVPLVLSWHATGRLNVPLGQVASEWWSWELVGREYSLYVKSYHSNLR
jgi:hypothetical protein